MLTLSHRFATSKILNNFQKRFEGFARLRRFGLNIFWLLSLYHDKEPRSSAQRDDELDEVKVTCFWASKRTDEAKRGAWRSQMNV
jgi:hypothetical protein